MEKWGRVWWADRRLKAEVGRERLSGWMDGGGGDGGRAGWGGKWVE